MIATKILIIYFSLSCLFGWKGTLSDADGMPESEVEWPSMALDLGRDVENILEEQEERHQAVAKWILTST